LAIVEIYDTTSFLACALDFLRDLERRGFELEDFSGIEIACGSASKRIELLHWIVLEYLNFVVFDFLLSPRAVYYF